MHLPPIDKRFAWLGLATAIALYAVIVVGGIVRVSGSGLGCPDWPQCYDQWVPPLEGHTAVEYAHRVVAATGSLLLAATALVAWLAYRPVAWISRPVVIGVGLLVVQIVLGGITVLLELPPIIVAVHLGTALALLAMVLVTTISAFYSRLRPALAVAGGQVAHARRYSHQVTCLALAAFVLLISGATVVGSGATWACPGLPVCGEQLISSSYLPKVQMVHRTIAVLVVAVLAWLALRGWRLRATLPGVGIAAPLALLFGLAQIGVGVAGVIIKFPQPMQGLHLAVGSLFWAAVVTLAALSYHGARRLAAAGSPTPFRTARPSAPRLPAGRNRTRSASAPR